MRNNLRRNLLLGMLFLSLMNQKISEAQNLNENRIIKAIELRNYVIRTGMRDQFIDYFEEHFIESQNAIGGYTLGQFRPKEGDNNFFWIRGFTEMSARSEFLPAFYSGPVWKQYGAGANTMLVNNDNVYLLKPLAPEGINSNEFGKEKGIMVIDFYVANSKLDKLIKIFREPYDPILKKAGVYTMLWISELTVNDFPRLPVFQDKNLLVGITFYENEAQYRFKMKQVETNVSTQLRDEMNDTITIQNTLILYPTKKSFGH
jgi:hypothetical protein